MNPLSPGGKAMKVMEIMEPVENNWLQPELTIYEAVCTMRRTKWVGEVSVNGMVVLEHGIKLVGVLSIKDIIRAVIPSYLENTLRGFTWEGMLEEYVKKARDIRVADIMSTELVTIGPEDTLMRCADLMIDNYLQRLPVVNEADRVLGIVHIRDLYIRITDLMCSIEEQS